MREVRGKGAEDEAVARARSKLILTVLTETLRIVHFATDLIEGLSREEIREAGCELHGPAKRLDGLRSPTRAELNLAQKDPCTCLVRALDDGCLPEAEGVLQIPAV